MPIIIGPETWNLLGQRSPKKGEYAVAYSGVDLKGVQILVAVDSSGYRHLLIPVPETTVVSEDVDSDGVQILSHELVDGKIRALFVDLICRKPHLNALFSELVEEVLCELNGATEGPDIVARKVLGRWRELLHRSGGGRLSYEAIVGLFGELIYLKKLVKISPLGLSSWLGPAGHRHDFERGKWALEVKTTTSKKGRIARINGVTQLDTSLGELLHLAFLRVEESNQAGQSIPELVEEIGKATSQKVPLLDALARVGYFVEHERFYGAMRFSVTESRLYRVDGEFPKIVPAAFQNQAIPPGVTELQYTIDLSSEPPLPISVSQEKVLLEVLARGEA